MDSIDIDPQPIFGMGSDNYQSLNRIRVDLGQEYFDAFPGLTVDWRSHYYNHGVAPSLRRNSYCEIA